MEFKDEEKEFLEGKESGIDREVNPIYEPREDSELLRAQIKEHAHGRVLDMGTGSGILAQEAATYAGEVYATDINPKAVEGLKGDGRIRALESDLFSNPELDRRFDLITFNPPYLPNEEGIEDMALFGGRKGHETTVAFIEQVADHLEDDGTVLLLFSTLTGKEKVEKAIERALLGWECIEEKPLFYERLYVYRITKTKLLRDIQGRGVRSLRYLTEGKRGMVSTAMKGNEQVVVKVTHPESEAKNRVDIEAQWLRKLEGDIQCPRLIDAGDSFIICDYIEGELIEAFVKRHEQSEIRQVLCSVLDQCRRLDERGIDKEEMHRPLKHIIVSERTYLIDFERAHHTERPRNVTQFCQFIASKGFANNLRERGVNIDGEALLSRAREYKKTYADADFKRVRELIEG